MRELLLSSKEIIDRAITDYRPAVKVLMLSGGDDSNTVAHVSKELGVKFDIIIHGITRTGIPETTDFVRRAVAGIGGTYLEADAGYSYYRYLLRKGFFGKGLHAHAFSYHILKQMHFERVVSRYIRQRRRNFKILFINGARRKESDNRMKTMIDPIIIKPRKPNDIWVNVINEWEKHDCLDYMDGNGIERNPVSIKLCRSGECMCGTMQSKGDRVEASYWYPSWGKWIDRLEAKIKGIHGFGWNDEIKNRVDPRQTDLFQPMCTGCKIAYETAQNPINFSNPNIL